MTDKKKRKPGRPKIINPEKNHYIWLRVNKDYWESEIVPKLKATGLKPNQWVNMVIRLHIEKEEKINNEKTK